MQTFTKYADLLAWVEQEKSPTIFLGCAPDGAPVISIRTGGDKTPAVFISAGSHATEQAGVSAAVALVEQLKTDHQVHIIPTRDPIGMNGFAYALGLSLEETPQLNSLEEIPGFLQAHGDILYRRDEVMLVLIGEYGYSTHNLYNKVDRGDSRLEPLWGSRIFFPSRDGGIEGTAPMQRAYTLIVTPDGEVLAHQPLSRHVLGSGGMPLYPPPDGQDPARLDAGSARIRQGSLLVFGPPSTNRRR